jgi:hypothetical protein
MINNYTTLNSSDTTGFKNSLKEKFIFLVFMVLFSVLGVQAQISVTVDNPTNTTPNLAASYGTLASALTDLNAVSAMTGPVTLTLTGSETAPPTGFTIGSATLNPVLSATNTVTLLASGAVTINAGVGTATPASAAPDGILKLLGADYVTLNGITFTDANAANPATMEYGVGLFKRAAGDGCNNNTIVNCIFNMQRINNASSTAPMVEGSVGILIINATPSAATTSLTPTNGGTLATNGTNSGNKFYTNTINNGNYGIVFSGFAATAGVGPAPVATTFLGDLGNDVGGVALATGNTILNFGGGATTSPSAGIRANNQWSINIRFNTIDNNNGSGVNHATTLRGIYAQAGTSAAATISNNNVTVRSSGTTSVLTAIENVIGSTAVSTNTIDINNNTIRFSYTTATTGVFTAILNSATAGTVNINSNNIQQNTATNYPSTGTIAVIVGGSPGGPMNITNNTISNFNMTGASGTLRAITASTPAGLYTVTGNTIENLSYATAGSTGSITGIYNLASATLQNVNSNIIRNFSTPATGTLNGIQNNTVAGTFQCKNNQIYNFSTTAGGAGGFSANGITWSNANVDISGNLIYSIKSTGTTGGTSGTIIGITHSGTANVYNNAIYDLASNSTNVVVTGINIGASGTNNIYNNLIGDLRAPFSTGLLSIAGINSASGSTNNIYHNTVNIAAATSSATTFGTSAIYFSSSTPVNNVRNNVFVNTSAPGPTGGFTAALRYTIAPTSTNFPATNNNNLYYAGVAAVNKVLYGEGSASPATNGQQTIAAYKTYINTTLPVSGRESNSVSEIPNFVSTTGSNPITNFLKYDTAIATQIEQGGALGTGISTDFTGTTVRCPGTGCPGATGTPDMGAWELNGLLADLTAPSISAITLVGNACGTITRDVTATIADPSGVATGGFAPVLYFRKGTSGAYSSVAGSLTVGTVNSGTWTFTINYATLGGVIPTDVVNYYIVAQDINANVGGSPSAGLVLTNVNTVTTPPTTPLSYTINSFIGGSYDVGATAPIYRTLTDAINAYNNSCLSSAVTFNLIDTSYNVNETFPIVINANADASAINTLTIKPNAAGTVINGSVASGALIKLNGAKYVTIDGSTSGGSDKSLTITNTNTTAPTVISLASLGTGLGATNNTIKNCNISTGVATTIGYGIAVGGSTPGTSGADNDNATIQNNAITVAPIGIYANGTASVTTGGDDNLNIIGNTIDYNSTLASIGIQAGNALSSLISQNTVSEQTSASGQPVAISIETGFVSSSVTRNNITKVLTTATGGYGGRGITVGTGTATSNLTIANNFISGVNGSSNYSSFTNSSSMGICIGTIGGSGTLTTTTGGINLFYNTVNMYGSYSYAASCLTTSLYIGSGSSALDIRDNILVNSMNNTNASGTASKNYTIYSAAANTAFSTIDYNDYYVSGSQGVLGLLTSDRTDLAGIVAGFGGNANSKNIAPVFISSSDLHLIPNSNISLNNLGTPVAVTTDYDGTLRNATTPDMGANEYTPTGCGSANPGTISPITQNKCVGQTVAMSTTGADTGLGISYQWEVSTTGGGVGFASVTGGTGATTTSYTSAALTQGTFYYRMKITCSNGPIVNYSNELTVTVNSLPSFTVSPPTTSFCGPVTPVLLTASNNTLTYAWSTTNGTLSNSGVGNPITATPTATATYTIIGTDPLTTCSSTVTASISVGAAVTMNSVIAGNSSICGTGSTTLTANASLPAPASYCASTHSSGCSGDNIARVVLNTLDKTTGTACGVSAAYSDFTALTGTNTTTLTGGSSYPLSLTFGTDGNQYFGAWIDYNQDGVFDVSEFLGASGNAGASGTIAVNFTVPLTAFNGVTRIRIVGGNDSAVTAGQACGASSSSFGETQDYAVTITGATNKFTYLWSETGAGTTLTSTTNNPTSATGISITKTYNVTATSTAGCTASGSTTVTVSALTCAAPTFSSPRCAGSNFTVTASASGGGNKSYAWNDNDGGTYPNAATITVNKPAGTYNFVCTVTDDCGSTPCVSSVSVTVNGLPTIAVAPTSGLICIPGGAAVPLSATAGLTSYTWLPTTGLDVSNAATVSANPSSTTTYTVTGTDNNGCTNTASSTITVSNAVVLSSVAASSPTVCSGGSTNLTANVTSNNGYAMSTASYGLLTATGTVTNTASTGDDILLDTVTLPFSFPFFGNSYSSLLLYSNGYVTFQSGVTGSPYTETIPTTASPNNYIAISHDDLNVNAAGQVSYFTNGISPNRIFVINYNGVKYYNSASNNGDLTGQIQLFESDGHIEIHVANSVDPTLSAKSLGIENATGTAGYSPATRNNVAYDITTPEAWKFAPISNSYLWSENGVGTTLTSTSTNPTSASGIAATKVYTVLVTSGAGCTATGNTTVTVTPLVCQPATVSGTLCAGSNFTVTANITGGGVPYHYVWSDGVTANTYTDTAAITANLPAGTYNFTCTVTDNCGTSCSSNVTVVVKPTPTSVPTSNSPICTTQTLQLTGGTDIGTSYSWTGPNGFTSTSQSPSITNVTSAASGTYSYTATADGCPSVTNTTTVVVNLSPSAITASASSNAVCSGVGFDLTSTNSLFTGSVSENFDGVTAPALPSGWSQTNLNSAAPNWVTTTTTPDAGINSAFVDDPTSVQDKSLVSPTIPISSATAVLSFRNKFGFESGFDGGVLEISNPSVAAGAFQDIITAGGSFTTGGYTSTISTSFSSPIAGRSAWSGTSTGYITTTVNLPPTAAGNSIKLRWRMGSDTSSGSTGWNIDTITLTDLAPISASAYSWTSTPAGYTVSGTQNPTGVIPTQNASYTVTVTAPNGCTATSSTPVVTITPLPTFTVSPIVICKGNSGTLSVVSSENNSYSWTDGVNNYSGPSITVSPNSTTTYSVSATSNTTVPACSTALPNPTVSITVNDPGTIITQPTDKIVAINNNTSFTVAGSPGVTYSYQWQRRTAITPVETWANLTTSANYTGVNAPTLNILNAGTGTALNNTRYRCVLTPVYTPAASPACADLVSNAVLLTVSTTGIATGLQSLSICLPASTSPLPQFSVVTNGDEPYFVQWEMSTNGGASYTPINLFNVDPDTDEYVYAGPVTLSGLTFEHPILDGSQVPTIGAYNLKVITVAGINNVSFNNYKFRATVNDVLPAGIATLNVSNPVSITTNLPVIPINVCKATTNTSLSIATSGSVSEIQWKYASSPSGPWNALSVSPPAGVTYSNAVATTLVVTTTSATPLGNYYYQATVIGSGFGSGKCPDVTSLIATITVNQPTVVASPTTTVYCTPGPAVTLSASGASTYAWTPATDLTNGGIGASVSATPSTNRTYTVTGTDAFGCTNTATVNVSVGASFTVTATSQASVCQGSAVTLGAVATAASGTTYLVNSTPYNFAATSGTFTALPAVGASGSTDSGVSLTADGSMSATLPLVAPSPSFTFNYGGVNYTNFRVSSDGFLVFGSAGTTSLTNNLATATSTLRPGLAPLWDDLQCTQGIKYMLQGTAPNRVLTIEWLNMEWNWSANNPTISFQIKLYETTNVIEYIYRQDAQAVNNGSSGASIGLMGTASTNFVSLQDVTASPAISTTSSTNGLSTKPATGQIYRFTPAAAPPTYTYAWTPATGLIPSATAQNPTNPALAANTTYNVTATSSAGCTASASTSVAVISTPVVTATNNGQPSATRCGTGKVNLTATGSTGAFLSWYDVPTGGSPLFTGTTFQTPDLSANKSYWVEATTYAPGVATYCAPTGGTSSTSYYLNNITTTGGSSNLAYTASSYTAFVNNSANTFSQSPGSSVNVSLGMSGGSTYEWYCWVDWNGDGDFADSGETIFATTSYTSSPYAGIISIPVGQAAGKYRVRFAGGFIGGLTACGPAPYGNYVDYTIAVGATCASPSRTQVDAVVNPAPALVLTSSTGTICLGQSTSTVNITPATVGNYTTYTWSPADTVSGSAASGYVFTPTTNTVYTLTATEAGGCIATTSYTVTVNPVPSIPVVSSNSPICQDSTLNLTASAVSPTVLSQGFESGVTFALNGWTVLNGAANNWFVGNAAGVQEGSNAAYVGTNNIATANANVNFFYRDVVIPVGMTNISLQFYLKMAIMDPTFDYVKVYVTDTSNTPVIGTLPSTGYTDLFSYGTITGTAALPNYTLQTVSLPNSLAGSTVRLVFTYKSDSVTPFSAPAIDNISITGTPVSLGYAWTGPNSFASAVQNPSIANVTTSATGTYNLEVTNSFGCKSSSTVSATINPLPTATIAGDATVCQNSASQLVTFTGANGTAPYTFTYKLNGGANQTIVSTGNTATIVVSAAVAATSQYTLVSVQDSSSTACSQAQSGTATVTVNPLPTATVSGTVTLCQNSPSPLVTFTGANGTAPYTFTYSLNGGANQTIVSSGNTATITVPTATAATYAYTLVSVQDSSSTTCSQLQGGTATVVVDPLPFASTSGSGTKAICSNSTYTLTASEATAANGTIAWTLVTGEGFISNGSTSEEPTYTAAPGDEGHDVTLLMTVTSNNTCGTATATASYTFHVDPLPTASTSGSGTKSICSNSAYTLASGEASANYGTISWTENGAGSITAGATSLTPTYTATAADEGNDVTLVMTVTSNNACGTATATATYTFHVDPLPTASTSGSGTSSICSYSSYSLTASEATANNGTIQWTVLNGAGSITSGATTEEPTYSAVAADAGNNVTLLMTVTSNNSCGTATATATYTLYVYPIPTVTTTLNTVVTYSGFPVAATPLAGTPSGVTFNITGGAASGLADVYGVTTIPSFIPTTVPSTVTVTPVANGCSGIPKTYQITFIPVIANMTSSQCGAVNHGLNNQIQAGNVSVPGHVTTGYRFEVTNTATGEVAYVDTVQSMFKLTDTSIYSYGTTFAIRVAVILDGNVQGFFGNTCTLTTASVQTTKVVTAQCGATLTALNSTINANAVSSTNLYRFRVARADAPTTYYLIERTVPNFNLSMVVGLPLTYDTEYKVDVQIRVKLAGFEAWSQYGAVCSVFTPAAPTTSLTLADCELVATSYSQTIHIIPYAGATSYRVMLTGYDGNGDVNYTQTVDVVSPTFTLSQFTGLTPDTTYTVAISINLFGNYTPYGKDCSVTTPSGSSRTDIVNVKGFKAVAYPNPFANNFMIDVKSSSQSTVNLKVYDMIGRLVEQRDVRVSDLVNATIGERYPSGVYNVVVSQDESVETVRVVKR